MSVIPAILSQHAEEAAFLWLRRERAVTQPIYRLSEIVKLDDQVEAQLEGLRIGGQAGWEMAQAELRWQEPGEVFTAGCLALESGASSRINHVIEIGCSAPELQRGLISALGWMPSDFVKDVLLRLLASPDPAARRVGMAGFAVRREDPGASLGNLLCDDDSGVRSRSLKAAGELGRVELLPAIRQATTDKNALCRFWAAWAAARLSGRSDEVVELLSEFASRPGPFQERAAAMTVLTMDRPVARDWLCNLARNATMLRPAAIGIGALGDPDLLSALLPLLQINEVARVAGEAFSMITGADLTKCDLDQEMPAGYQTGPTEDPDDESTSLDPDENLPWPDPTKLAMWWEKCRADFEPRTRYLCGKPLTQEWLEHVLRRGYQRQRAAAALELAIRNPVQPLFNVRAPAFRQQQWLGIK